MKIPYKHILLGIIFQLVVGVILDSCKVPPVMVGSLSTAVYFLIAFYPLYKN